MPKASGWVSEANYEVYPPTEGRCRMQSLEWCRKAPRVASDKSEFHLSQFVFSVFRGLKLDFYRREVDKNGSRAMMWSDQAWSEPPFPRRFQIVAMSNLPPLSHFLN